MLLQVKGECRISGLITCHASEASAENVGSKSVSPFLTDIDGRV